MIRKCRQPCQQFRLGFNFFIPDNTAKLGLLERERDYLEVGGMGKQNKTVFSLKENTPQLDGNIRDEEAIGMGEQMQTTVWMNETKMKSIPHLNRKYQHEDQPIFVASSWYGSPRFLGKKWIKTLALAGNMEREMHECTWIMHCSVHWIEHGRPYKQASSMCSSSCSTFLKNRWVVMSS